MPTLVLIEPQDERYSLRFEKRALLGRESSNDLQLQDPRASRHHAMVYRDERGLFFVEDLRSRNGTFVGQKRVQREQLAHGQEFRIGSSVIRFEHPRPSATSTDSFLLDPVSLTTETGTRLPLFAAPGSKDGAVDLLDAYRGLVALFELGNLLHASRQDQDIYQGIAQLVVRTTGAELVAIAELDDGQAEPSLCWLHPLDGLEGSGFTLSTTIVRQVLDEGRAVLIRDVEAFHGAHQAASLEKAPVLAVLCAPLRSQQAVRGIISAASTSSSEAFCSLELQLLTAIGLQAGIALENRGLYRELEASFLGTVEALVNALDAKDEYTAGHARRVAGVSEAIARRLGLPEDAVREVRLGALLHDIGKIGVPEALLGARRRLSEPEFDQVRRHALIGDTILHPLLRSEHARAIVRNHHERWDGGGYPDGLTGAAIPLACRIVAVADTIDAITSRRPYREAGELAGALREVQRCADTQFDPEVVHALLEVAVAERGLEPLLER